VAQAFQPVLAQAKACGYLFSGSDTKRIQVDFQRINHWWAVPTLHFLKPYSGMFLDIKRWGKPQNCIFLAGAAARPTNE